MESIIIIIIIIIVVVISIIVITVNVQSDKTRERTKAEKYGKATGDYLRSVAESVAGAVESLAESKEHKKKRSAEEEVAEYTGRYLRKQYRCEEPYNPTADYNKDNQLRNALSDLGISKEQWLKDCNLFIKLSPIVYYYKKDKSYVNSPERNESIYKRDNDLRSSLEYFSVPKKDWVKYGTTVLRMYDLYVDGLSE